jgi:glucose/arabinose dehydrogenase
MVFRLWQALAIILLAGVALAGRGGLGPELRIPWGVAFLPDGTALVTERGNQVPKAGGEAVPRILAVTPDGRVREVQRLPEVSTRPGGSGLLGIAVSPRYATDKWVYVYYSTDTDNRIARLHLGEAPQPILTGIPLTAGPEYHQGGRLAFGPDGMLYAATGDDQILRVIP